MPGASLVRVRKRQSGADFGWTAGLSQISSTYKADPKSSRPYGEDSGFFGQPIPLTIKGPSRFATASGSCFQAAIRIPSLGFSGFKSGIERPRLKQNW